VDLVNGLLIDCSGGILPPSKHLMLFSDGGWKPIVFGTIFALVG
jgi:hypothetical protein